MSQQPRSPAPTGRPRDELHPRDESRSRDETPSRDESRAWEAILWQRLNRRRATADPQRDAGTTS